MTDTPKETVPVTQPNENFEQLPLARADIPVMLSGQYRVYTDAKNFKLVEADSAVHALEASGLEKALKIEREAWHKATLLTPKFAADGAAAVANPA